MLRPCIASVVLTHSVFASLVAQAGDVVLGVGHARRSDHHGKITLFVDEVAFPADLGATSFHPFKDRVVLTTRPVGTDASARELARPVSSCVSAVVSIGSGEVHSGWDGWLFFGCDAFPVEEVRIVGPGQFKLTRDNLDELPSETSLRRASRTLGPLGAAAWNRLRKSRVLLIGCGRTGSMLAHQLAALQVHSLVLIDEDHLELENLNAMVGVKEADTGQSKVLAVQNSIAEFNPECTVTAIEASAKSSHVEQLAEGADLIVTCVDSDLPRLCAALMARRFLKVHLDVGTGIQRLDDHSTQMAGDIRLMLPGSGCLLCVGGLPKERDAWFERIAPHGAIPLTAPTPWFEDRLGSLISLNSIAVGTAVQLWLDLLTGDLRSSFWQRFNWQRGQGPSWDGSAVTAGSNCRICSGDILRKQVIA